MSFLDAEGFIVEKLKASLAEAGLSASVMTQADIDAVRDKSHIAPALCVVFDRYSPTQQVGSGIVQEIEQIWTIWVVVKNAINQTSGDGLRAEASLFIDLVLSSLCGWSPANGFRPLRLEQGAGPDFGETGFAFFPLNFSTRLHVRGS